MEKLDSAQSLRELFERALTILLEKLNPERAFIAYKDGESGELVPQGTHGIDPQAIFVTGEISTEIIKTVMREGKPINLVDAIHHPGFANRTSVILSGLRSIVCVPIKHPSGLIVGMIYADNRLKAGAFDQEHLDWLCELAEGVEQRLVAAVRASGASAQASEAAGGPVSPELEANWREARAEGVRLFQAGQVDQAEPKLLEAVALAERFGPLSLHLAKSLADVAELHRARGQLDLAERSLIRSIDIFEKLGDHTSIAPSLNNLAGLYYSQGYGTRAEGFYLRALKIWEETLEPDDRRLAPVLYNLGTIRHASQAYAEAAGFLQRALRIAEKAWGPDHPHSQRCRSSLEQASKLASS